MAELKPGAEGARGFATRTGESGLPAESDRMKYALRGKCAVLRSLNRLQLRHESAIQSWRPEFMSIIIFRQ